MKKIFCLLLLVFSGVELSYAQDFDQQMTERSVNCSDVAVNSSRIFMQYMNEQKTDSAALILDYWENKCGLVEPVYRARILLAIENRTFNDKLLGDQLLGYISDYIYTIVTRTMDEGQIADTGYKFDEYTKKWAEELLPLQADNSEEGHWCSFYAGYIHQFAKAVEAGVYPPGVLTDKYAGAIKEVKRAWRYTLSAGAGTWIPVGSASVLGVHPELGFQVGVKKMRFLGELDFTFRFLNAKEPYNVYHHGITEVSKHFFGGYVGVNLGYELLKSGRHSLDIVGGIGAEGFDCITSKDKDKNVSTFVLGLNAGLRYTYTWPKGLYCSVRPYYSYADYSKSKKVDMAGNAIGLRLTFGGIHLPARVANMARILGIEMN